MQVIKQLKLNILSLVSYPFMPWDNGGRFHNFYIHKYLAEICNAYVVGSKQNDETKVNIEFKFKLIKLFSKSPYQYIPFNNVFKISKLIDFYNIDAIFMPHPYLGFNAILLKWIKKTPLILYSHNIESTRFKSLGKKWWPALFLFEKIVMKNSDLIFFITDVDRNWAIKNYNLNSDICFIAPSGTVNSKPPALPSNELVIKKLVGDNKIPIAYFAGDLGYFPNREAIENILLEVIPRLRARKINLKIIILGKKLDQIIIDKIKDNEDYIEYLGFVDDLNQFILSSDLMLNPMQSGGGIKTKAVEALGFNIKVISTENGAVGIDRAATNNMLFVSQDQDWDQFVTNIEIALTTNATISNAYYDIYYWGNIVKLMVNKISQLRK